MSKLRRSVEFVNARARLAALALTLAIPAGVAVAQPIGTLPAGSPLSAAQIVTNFKSNPEQLLTQNPNGGAELISRARDLAVNDEATLDLMLALFPKANKDQKTAIATGLGQAARIVVRANQPYSTRIAQAIAETKDLDIIVAYAAGSGDTGTAATGAGAAGSAGASGGQTTGLGAAGSGGSLEAINGSSVNTGNFSFTASTSGSGSSTGATTTNLATTGAATTGVTTTTVSP